MDKKPRTIIAIDAHGVADFRRQLDVQIALAHQRAVLQQLFVTVWLEKTEVTAVQPSPLFMPLLVASHHLYTTSTGVEAARRRRTPIWRGFAAPVLV